MTEDLAKALPATVVADLAVSQHASGPDVVHARGERAWTPASHKEHEKAFDGLAKERPVTERGIQKKAAVATPVGRFLIKPYFETHKLHMPRPVGGWAEMTSQALYHAAGVGHLHQQVHVQHAPDADGREHPFIAIKVAPQHEEIDDRHKLSGNKEYHPEAAADARKISVLDFLSGNTDRHGSNLMVGPEGRPLAIDHGLAFQYHPRSVMRCVAQYHVNATSLIDPTLDPEAWGDTMSWWRDHGERVAETFRDRIGLIKDPKIRDHIETNFNARLAHLNRAVEEGDAHGFLQSNVPIHDRLSDVDPDPVPNFPRKSAREADKKLVDELYRELKG
jgi:hypothetical protein